MAHERKHHHFSYDECSKEVRARPSLRSSAFTRTTESASAKNERHVALQTSSHNSINIFPKKFN